ncbi:anti-sigma factor family protein, partial [Singulisphaera rosea]
MNFDDESILSAYIDGELDPEDRQRVELAILSDPFLDERVRQLSSVQQWVGQLSRPTSGVDLTSSVLQAIDRQLTYGPTMPSSRRFAGWRAVAEYAVAATIVLSLSAGLWTVLKIVPPNVRTPVQVAKTTAPVSKPDGR